MVTNSNVLKYKIDVIKGKYFQQVQPDSICLSGTGVSLRITSVMSSFLGSVDSIPGRAAATLLNNCFTLYPALAEVSINITLSSLA